MTYPPICFLWSLCACFILIIATFDCFACATGLHLILLDPVKLTFHMINTKTNLKRALVTYIIDT